MRRRVDDEVGVSQGFTQLRRLPERHVAPELRRVPISQPMNHVQPLAVDIHEGNGAALEALFQANVADQTQ
jgi:hypothetical protein